MAGNDSYLGDLENALRQRSAYLVSSVLTQLKENFRSLHSNIQALVQLCQKKGVLKQDPYHKERQISEVQPPADDQFADAFREDELSIRLSEYDSQFDFLLHYSSFSLEHLGLKDLKAMLGMVRFIRWDEFSPHTTKPSTRVFAEVLDKIRKGSDSFASGAISSSISQCQKLSREITEGLRDLSSYKREEYKFEIRSRITSKWDVGTTMPSDMFLKEVKRSYAAVSLGQPYFPDLVEEIYNEDFSPDGEELRRKALASLETRSAAPVQGPKPDQLKEILFEGLRLLGTASRHLDIALGKLRENSALIENRPKKFIEKFKDWIISLSSGKVKQIVYEIEFVDLVTSVHSTKALDFVAFAAHVEKKSRILQGFINKQSATYTKLRGADEDQLYSLLDRNLGDLTEIHKQMDALDEYFKTEVGRISRDNVKGIKQETANINGAIQTASQKKHEYIARKDESEQLQKLGIKTQ